MALIYFPQMVQRSDEYYLMSEASKILINWENISGSAIRTHLYGHMVDSSGDGSGNSAANSTSSLYLSGNLMCEYRGRKSFGTGTFGSNLYNVSSSWIAKPTDISLFQVVLNTSGGLSNIRTLPVIETDYTGSQVVYPLITTNTINEGATLFSNMYATTLCNFDVFDQRPVTLHFTCKSTFLGFGSKLLMYVVTGGLLVSNVLTGGTTILTCPVTGSSDRSLNYFTHSLGVVNGTFRVSLTSNYTSSPIQYASLIACG
jgi:hypothetical protein